MHLGLYGCMYVWHLYVCMHVCMGLIWQEILTSLCTVCMHIMLDLAEVLLLLLHAAGIIASRPHFVAWEPLARAALAGHSLTCN